MAKARMVELHLAYIWTCEDCGRDQFERSIRLAPEAIASSQSIQEALARNPEIQEWTGAGGENMLVTTPDRVRCQHCGSEFSIVEL